jgi:hypothetical protein
MRKTMACLLLAVSCITLSSLLCGSPRLDYVKPVFSDLSNSDTFPVPPAKKNMLFYVQRTLNTNTIVYEVNYNKDSTLSAKDPVHIYWIHYASDGGIKDLSYIQRRYAYGLDVKMVDSVKLLFKVNFVSYKKRDIFLVRSGSWKIYKACMLLHNKLSYIQRIFVQIDGGTFWVPRITYVEIIGTDITSGKPVTEKIIP